MMQQMEMPERRLVIMGGTMSIFRKTVKANSRAPRQPAGE
jgi:hypothetical protein